MSIVNGSDDMIRAGTKQKGSKSFWESHRIRDSHSQPGNPSSAGQKSTKHIGFDAAAKQAAKSYGGDIERGRAAIAASTRRASASAKKKNPALKKVKG